MAQTNNGLVADLAHGDRVASVYWDQGDEVACAHARVFTTQGRLFFVWQDPIHGWLYRQETIREEGKLCGPLSG